MEGNESRSNHSARPNRGVGPVKRSAADLTRHEPIAIVGIGCRLPGDVRSPDAFWKVLSDGRDVISEIPPDRWDVDEYYDPEPGTPGKSYSRYGGFIDRTEHFDPGFFQISPREAAVMDPEQRLLLEVTWEAIEHAGISQSRLEGSDGGVFLGISNGDYQILRQLALGLEALDTYAATGGSLSVAAGRLSYFLGLHGPAISIDTACSSSLVAIHQACQSLRFGESSIALAGGVSLILSPVGLVTRAQARMLSPDGRCHTFDADANGYVRSEGCAMIVLKRLSDARADGDRVLAVIRGSAINQDGRTPGLTAPSETAQMAVIRSAVANAGIEPADVTYVEAHGTGTRLGDPIELRGLAGTYGHGRSTPLTIGSVKTNVGHTEAAAGVIGLIKVVLALQHGTIPRHLHFRRGNPDVDWNSLALQVASEPVPWPSSDSPRLAGVSSFGFSGTNAHVILGDAAETETVSVAGSSRRFHVLPLSARSERALDAVLSNVVPVLRDDGAGFAEVCAEAGIGRSHFDHRAAIVARSSDEAANRLSEVLAGDPTAALSGERVGGAPSIAFLFTGQGALYPGMGADLYESEPVFRQAMEEFASLADPHLERPLLDVIFGRTARDAELSEQALYAQPGLFCLEYGLMQLWQAWGVSPAAVFGHSLGEYAAASAAGVWSLEDAVRLVLARGSLMQDLPIRPAAMVAVMAAEPEVARAMETYGSAVSLAAFNGPENIVVSGDRDAVESLCQEFEARGITCKMLRVSHAFHSAHMDPMLDEFERVAATVTIHEPRVPMVSSLTGEFATREELAQPGYWRREIREAVQFQRGMRTLWEEGIRSYLEAGPHPVLLGMGRACVPGDQANWLPSIRRNAESEPVILDSLARVYVSGVDVDWSAVYSRQARPRTLPTYPFQRERYGPDLHRLVSPGTTTGFESKGGIPLLGHPVDSPGIDGLLFEGSIGIGDPAFLNDHRVHGSALVPGLAFPQMAFAAAAQLPGDHRYLLSRLTVKKALVLPEEGRRRFQTMLKPDEEGGYTFEVHSKGDDEDSWTQHVVGHLHADDARGSRNESLKAILDEPSVPDGLDDIGVERYYNTCARRGTALGPSFRALNRIVGRVGLSIGHIRVQQSDQQLESEYFAHPVLLDSAVHLMCSAIPEEDDDVGVHVPVGVQSIRIYQPGATEAWAHASFEEPADGNWAMFTGDIRLVDADGWPVADLDGIELHRIQPEALQALTGKGESRSLFEIDWREASESSGSEDLGGRWLLFADDGGIGDGVAGRIVAAGGQCVLIRKSSSAGANGSAIRFVDPDDPDGITAATREAMAEGAIAGVIFLWSLDLNETGLQPSLTDLRRSAGALLAVLQEVARSENRPRGLLAATKGAHNIGGEPGSSNPDGGVIWGLLRTASFEIPGVKIAGIDLDSQGDSEVSSIIDALSKRDSETEVAYRDGRRHIARLTRMNAKRGAWSWGERKPFRLHIARRGSLEHLIPVEATRRAPGIGEVEIRVVATGLNFRDVLNVLGMYPGDPGPPGGECAGRVVRVGPGVTGVNVGDAVFGLAQGAFSTYVTTSASFVARKPVSISFEQAATLPITFLTAVYGLHRLATLSSSDRVLIHSGAGGVGQAAIQLAQRAGATVFATAGSPAKRDFLRDRDVDYVMDSRSLDFGDQIREQTGGEGVTIVLNALTGDYIDEGLRLLDKGGHFLEIGKRDIRSSDDVRKDHPNVTYLPFDLGDVMRLEPALIHEMLLEIVVGIEDGSLEPLPVTAFPVWEAESAFRYMARARHIGKIVVVQEDEADQKEAIIRPDATYLITGGLSGLGLLVAERLADRGARYLVLLSRREPSESDSAIVDRIRESGVEIRTAQVDVSDADGVAQLIATINAEMPPLRGIVHGAGVLDDGILAEQTWSRFETVMKPKVLGAWTLHEATLDQPLDFFVLFSSIASAFGSAGQANYAAANAYLDALSGYRRSLGLPSVSINWGPWGEVGMAARLGERYKRRFEMTGVRLISPNQGLDMLEEILKSQQKPGAAAGAIAVPIYWPKYHETVLQGRSWPLLADLVKVKQPTTQKTATPEEDIKAVLRTTPVAERAGVVASFLRNRISRITGLPLDDVATHRPLTQLGLDSLMAVEFKGQVEATLRATISVGTLLRGASLDEVAEELVQQLEAHEEKADSAGNGKREIGGDEAALLLEQIDSMPDEEVESLLKQLGRSPDVG